MNNITTTTTLNGETLFTLSGYDIPPETLEFINRKDTLTHNTSPFRAVNPGDRYDFSVTEQVNRLPNVCLPYIHYLVNRQLTKDNQGKTIPQTVMSKVTDAVLRQVGQKQLQETVALIQSSANRAVEFFESQHVTYEEVKLTNRFQHAVKMSGSTFWLLSLSNQPRITPAEKLSLIIALAGYRIQRFNAGQDIHCWDTIGVYNPLLEGIYTCDMSKEENAYTPLSKLMDQLGFS